MLASFLPSSHPHTLCLCTLRCLSRVLSGHSVPLVVWHPSRWAVCVMNSAPLRAPSAEIQCIFTVCAQGQLGGRALPLPQKPGSATRDEKMTALGGSWAGHESAAKHARFSLAIASPSCAHPPLYGN